MNPRSLTLRQLVWMSDGKRQHDWGLISSLLAATFEVHRDPKRRRRPYQPAEFNPLLQRPCQRASVTVTQLANIFKASGRDVRIIHKEV